MSITNTDHDECTFMEDLMKEIDIEMDQYYVGPGARIVVNPNTNDYRHEEYIVSMTVLGTALSSQLDGGKIWKLFSLVNLQNGVNYAYPVPVMSDGLVDIRKLFQVGTWPIDDVVFLEKVNKKRTYTVKDQSGYISQIVVD